MDVFLFYRKEIKGGLEEINFFAKRGFLDNIKKPQEFSVFNKKKRKVEIYL